MSAPAAAPDPGAEAAALIGEAGRSAEDARRYRALADSLAPASFDRALAIGSEIRAAARRGAVEALVPFAAELRGLVARCRDAVGEVREGRTYQEAVRAFRSGDAAKAAALACDVFSGVAPRPGGGTLYYPLAIGGGRSVDHFLALDECAARIDACHRDGLTSPSAAPDRGGNEEIRPIALTARHDEAESPIALAFEAGTFGAPTCALTGTETVLLYSTRTRADFVVSCAPRVSDEWWEIRPDAYRAYVDGLRAALAARSITLIVEPEPDLGGA